MSALIPSCAGGRPSEAMHAFHPASSSTSGDKLVLTRRLVLAIAHLSNPAIRVASASTNRLQISVGQSAVDIAVRLRLIPPEVFRAQEHLKGSVADESGQPRHRTAAGDHPDAHFPLRDDRLFSAGETHSHASVISLPFPVARPRIMAIDATGERVSRTRKSGQGGKPVGPAGIEVRSSSLVLKSE